MSRHLPILIALGLALTAPALAEGTPYQTVVDKVDPAVDGLTIQGDDGPCDLRVLNRTGGDVLLFDLQHRPLTIHSYQAPLAPPNAVATPRPEPAQVHLLGDWPCGQLPAVTEEQHWNAADSTLLTWTIPGWVNQRTFSIRGRTFYHAEADPVTLGYRMARYASAILLILALLFALPWLAVKRRRILRAES